MRQKVGRLVHQVDPKSFILHRSMDMHTADQHPIGKGSEVRDQTIIAFVSDPSLIPAARKRMG